MAGEYGIDNPAGYIADLPPQPPTAQTDPLKAKIDELLASLDMGKPMGPAPTRPNIATWRRILGAIGDALESAASVRAGHGPIPVGGFESMMRNQQQQFQQQLAEYQKQQQENEQAARMLKNNLKIAFSQDAIRQAGEEKLAMIKAAQSAKNRPIRSEFTRDVGGISRRFRQLVDPNTGEVIDEADLGPAGYAPYIQPAIPGVSGPERIPRQGPAGQVGGNVPPPPPGTSKDVTTALNMRVLYNDALKSFQDYTAKTGRTKRTITSMGRKLPGIGSALEETVLSFQDPEGVTVARKIDNLADILLRLRSGAQINDAEFQRLRSLLPKLGENPTTAMANFRRFETELHTTIRVARERAPALFTPELLQSLGLGESDMSAGGGGGASVDDILEEWDARRKNANPAP